ncbi:MAG: hypothetical protein INR65_19480 [Gluconacetobacter diazotrophicus]|nr:hypothetical protein [Gluconacetobacter diazotrophicus]
MAYYLIHHLRDNDHAAKLSAPAQPGLANAADGAKLTLGAPAQTFQVDLGNGSPWLDLIPVVRVQVNDATAAWNVTFACGGQDITAAVRSAAGFCFCKADRLNPGSRKTISVTVAARSGQAGHGALDVSLQLFPHPTTPVVEQTIHLRN